MSAADFFNAARAHKRELTGNPAVPLTQDDVDALNAVVQRWKPVGLTKPAAFFQSIRDAFGPLDQGQVDGFNFLTAEMAKVRWPIAWAAYGLATAWHETARTMQPVEEAYYLGAKADAYRKGLRYYPWHGRGYPQTTWERNYQRADDELELGGRLMADPALMLTPAVAGPTMIRGMEAGWFTGKRLADYLPLSGQAGHDAYKRARKIINGTDRDAEIAKVALAMEAALAAGGWA